MEAERATSACPPKDIVTCSIMDVNVRNYDSDQLWSSVCEKISLNESAVVVAVNPEKVMLASRDHDIRDILATFEFPIVDGIGILAILKMKGIRIKQRLTGIDAMETLISRSREIQAPLFFYGAKPGVAEKAAEFMSHRYPGIVIAGIMDGYQKDRSIVLDTIVNSGAKIVFVALGSPVQEHFMFENRDKLSGCILQGVGGSFDVFSGNKSRAPAFFRKFGLEWFFRLVCEPWRIRRQLSIVRFILRYLIVGRKSSEKAAI